MRCPPPPVTGEVVQHSRVAAPHSFHYRAFLRPRFEKRIAHLKKRVAAAKEEAARAVAQVRETREQGEATAKELRAELARVTTQAHEKQDELRAAREVRVSRHHSRPTRGATSPRCSWLVRHFGTAQEADDEHDRAETLAASLQIEQGKVKTLRSAVKEAQTKHAALDKKLNEMGAGEGRTLLDAIQSARRAREEAKAARAEADQLRQR